MLAFSTIFRGQTSAGNRSWPAFDIGAGLPQISLKGTGETPWTGYTPGTDWIVGLRCHARTMDECYRLYSEARAILLPTATPNEGFYGPVTVQFDGVPRTVTFSGIKHNAGPNELEDVPTRTPMLESIWIVPHY